MPEQLKPLEAMATVSTTSHQDASPSAADDETERTVGVQFEVPLRPECRIAAWLVVSMVALAALVLWFRWVFGMGSIWMQELVLWLHAGLFLSGGYLALRDNKHIRIELFDKLSQHRKRRIHIVGHILFLTPMMAVLIVTSLPPVVRSWQQLESSAEAGGMPGLFVLKTFLPLAALLMLIGAWLDILRGKVSS